MVQNYFPGKCKCSYFNETELLTENYPDTYPIIMSSVQHYCQRKFRLVAALNISAQNPLVQQQSNVTTGFPQLAVNITPQ